LISWIVASHDPDILNDNLVPTLELAAGDELIVIADAPSIAVAYNRGQAKTSNAVRCYVHHDVQILEPQRLRAQLLQQCTAAVGMIGVIGSTDRTLPWWEGATLGSVVDGRMGRLDFGPGGPCTYLDGLLLATVQHVDWDEEYPGWHAYDLDACQQMLSRGLTNWCLDDGHELVFHNTTNSANTGHLQHYHENIARFRTKWNRTD
jgi:hypothetical protein